MGGGGGVGVCEVFLKKCIVDLNVYLKSMLLVICMLFMVCFNNKDI